MWRDAVTNYNPTTVVMLLRGGCSISTKEPNYDPRLIRTAQRGPPIPKATCDTLTVPAVVHLWAAQVVSLSASYAFQQVITLHKPASSMCRRYGTTSGVCIGTSPAVFLSAVHFTTNSTSSPSSSATLLWSNMQRTDACWICVRDSQK